VKDEIELKHVRPHRRRRTQPVVLAFDRTHWYFERSPMVLIDEGLARLIARRIVTSWRAQGRDAMPNSQLNNNGETEDEY
jgi:hypothetical protein